MDSCERRKNYIIDVDFQAKFILKFCLIVVFASILTGTLIYHFNMKTTTVAFTGLKVGVKTTADFILPIVLQILVIVTALVGAATVLLTTFVSHKISGPLYRLKIELGKMKDGNLSAPIRIRATDQLQKVAGEAEEMRLKLQGSIRTMQCSWDMLKHEIAALPPEKRKGMEEAKAKIDGEFNGYKLG